MIKQKSLSLRILAIALIGALVVGGCSGTLSLGGGLDLDGDDGGAENGSNVSQNQLLVVLMVILLVVSVVGILR